MEQSLSSWMSGALDHRFYEKAASYAPAFGMLIGTLVGPDDLMLGNMSDVDACKGMAVALIAHPVRFLLLANIIFLASKLKARRHEENSCASSW